MFIFITQYCSLEIVEHVNTHASNLYPQKSFSCSHCWGLCIIRTNPNIHTLSLYERADKGHKWQLPEFYFLFSFNICHQKAHWNSKLSNESLMSLLFNSSDSLILNIACKRWSGILSYRCNQVLPYRTDSQNTQIGLQWEYLWTNVSSADSGGTVICWPLRILQAPTLTECFRRFIGGTTSKKWVSGSTGPRNSMNGLIIDGDLCN